VRRAAWWIALLLLVAGCAGDRDATDGPSLLPEGNASAFCVRWPEARSTIVAEITVPHESEYKRAIATVRDTLDQIGLLVPPDIRTVWETAIGYKSTVVQLIDIAGSPGAIRAEFVAAAFPAGDPEAAERAALDAVVALDEWSIARCGDFCELWPRLDRALSWNLRPDEGGVDQAVLMASGRDDATLLDLAEPLVPADVRATWDRVAGMKRSLVATLAGMEDGDEPDRVLQEQLWALTDPHRLWDRFMGRTEGEGLEALAEELGSEPWLMGPYIESMVREPLATWVAANCETIGGGGLPGSVTVRTDESGGRARGTLLVAALPVGTDFRATASARDYDAAVCFDGYPGDHGPRSAFLLEREDDFRQPCAWLEGWDHGGPREAVLDAGRYDLFFGLFTRGMGDYDGYLAAPETCATLTVVVDGDIDVGVPLLEPCGMQYLVGDPGEYLRRNPPPPEEPTGTLRIVVSDFEPPDDDRGLRHGGSLVVAVVPAGTTLNDIGGGEVWPSGAGCLGLPGPDELGEITEGVDRAFEEADGRRREADQAAEQAQEALRHADRTGEEADRALADAEQLYADAQRLQQQAALGGEEAERLNAEADRVWQEAEEAQHEADRFREEAERAAEEAEWSADNAARMSGDADDMRRWAEEALQRREAFEAGVALVVASFPEVPEGVNRACRSAFEILGDPAVNAEPVRLTYGTYDVHLQQSWYGDERELHVCGRLTVEIDGDVVVPLPELGDCP
jgi:hypothetical protein